MTRIFLLETGENLEKLDNEFLYLEKRPGCLETVGCIFRHIHTIKGSAGFLGLARLEKLAHAGESLLSEMRDGKIAATPPIVTALLGLLDAVRRILGRLERGEGEGDEDFAALVATLEAFRGAAGTAPAAQDRAVSVEPLLSAPAPVPVPTAAAPSAERQPAAPSAGVASPASDPGEERRGGAAESSIRVDIAHLDKMMNLVGELVLARNELLQFRERNGDPSFQQATQRLNLVTTELQERLMRTRMQPIGNVWSMFPRVVRDLSLQLGKRIEVAMEGRDTELDKSILETIRDPLTHLVRNSVDHGIETPDARRAAGKPECGRILLRAYHEGGLVNLEITDDGAGIRVDRVVEKAIERGIVTPEAAEEMDDRAALQLIFLPGFSTAEKVTAISGRGVGMDVVKRNFERIGGHVDVQSSPGRGTTFRVKIPLTLAIIPALLVREGGEKYAIPQVNLLEVLRLPPEGDERIERIYGEPVYRLRGRLLPVARLSALFGRPDGEAGERATNVVVLQADERQFGLVVDEILDTEEIVVKPLSARLKALGVYAGATVMGDGAVALILDVIGLAKRARLAVGAHAAGGAFRRADDAPEAAAGERRALLVFRPGGGGRMAVPLDAVRRLEEFDPAAIERAGDRDVVQYRGGILPLLRLDSVMTDRRAVPREAAGEPPARVPVLVCRDGERTAGIMVERILDIVEERVALERPASRPGVLGAAVVRGSVTEFLDLSWVLRGALAREG